jgi:hypothetical protein
MAQMLSSLRDPDATLLRDFKRSLRSQNNEQQ